MLTMPQPRRYSVLYYKRSNKVHKNRGTTREDGILTIAPPPSCACTLVSVCDDDDDDDADSNANALDDDDSDDDDSDGGNYGGKKKKSKKQKYQKIRKKMNNSKQKSKSGKIWSGVNSDLARRAFDLDVEEVGIGEDDTLALSGQWECEIVSVLSKEGSSVAMTKSGGLGGRLNGMVKRGTGLSSMRKQPPAMGSINSMQNRAPLGALRKNTIKPLQSKKVGLGGVKRTLGSTAKLPSNANAAPPPPAASAAGKMKKDAKGEWFLDKPESDDEDTTALASSRSMSSKVPASLLRTASSTANKRPRIVSSLNHGTKGSTKLGSGNVGNSNATDFPGALGDKINVPASIRNILRPHQKEGIAFLWNCVTGVNEGLKNAMLKSKADMASSSNTGSWDEDESGSEMESKKMGHKGELPRGAVLADEMGLGKTLMTIATIFAYHRHRSDRRFIVVCPSSLVSNWSKEFDKWLGKASQPKRVLVRNGLESEGLRSLKSFVPLKPNLSEVLILSYELFRMHVKVINKAGKIGMLVVDEGHRLKNTSGSQILTALNSIEVESRILITGTPIQNNLSEFYNVANFAVPNILGDLPTFRRLYDRPMSTANQKNASTSQKQKGRQQSKALDAITSTFVLRRLQKDILKSLLPPRMELLLFCRPTERQCELYRGIAQRASKSIGSIGGAEACNNPLMLLTEVRKLCTHPSLLKNGDDAADSSLSGKMVVLANLIDSIRSHNPTDKVVIISNFTSALTVIENSILRKKGLSFLRLDGSTDNKIRGSLVDSFNKGSVDHSFAFLLSSKAGGCGLNLIGANRLVMVDADWNPATDHQAMARVYRQGQTKPCFVYRMFTTGTVEEVIYQRQLQKGNLAKMANDGGSKKTKAASFSKEELRDCFTLKEDCKCDTQRKLGIKWSDYDGASSLTSQGCMDGPLLGVCEDDDEKTTLSFVRVVGDDDEEEPTTTVTTGDDDDDNDEEVSEEDVMSSERSFSSHDDDEPSSEEEEFDG